MMIDAEAVKDRISCRQFAEFMGLKINRAGFAVCPFHSDSDASLKIYDDGKGWCCFGCHKGGDVINMASLYYGLGFRDTISRLNADFNLGFEHSDSCASGGLLSAVRLAASKSSRSREKRLREATEARYWASFDAWLSADRRVRDLEPPRDGDWPDEFVQALADRAEKSQRLSDAESRRIQFNG